MNLLLDTCAILYCELYPEKLSTKASKAITNSENILFISSLSVAEIACAWGKKIKSPKHWRPWPREAINNNGWNVLDPDYNIFEESYSLPEPFHRDPVDRALVATARLHNLTLITNDTLITKYPYVNVLW